MGHVRAKFHALHITANHGDTFTVEMAPVIGNGDAASDENTAFWKATPSGNFKISFRGPVPDPIKVDGFYYLDVFQGEAKGSPDYLLEELTHTFDLRGEQQGKVRFSHHRPWDPHTHGVTSAVLELHIDNIDAMQHFPDGGPGWAVVISEAPA